MANHTPGMADNSQAVSTLRNLLYFDAYKFLSAEIQLETSLKKWINDSASLQLKNILQKYLDFVQQHIREIESFLGKEEINMARFTNKVMGAFIEETDERLSACTQSEIKDVCLLANIQAINHFKISKYGTAAAFANELGMEKQANLFHHAEVHEKQIDDRLSQLAEHDINMKARAPIVLPG